MQVAKEFQSRQVWTLSYGRESWALPNCSPRWYAMSIIWSTPKSPQEPRLVVVPQFEASGLNDDIWADVHKGMVEVAELLNGMMDKNKGDEQPASPTAVRNNSVARRQSGAGRWKCIQEKLIFWKYI